MDLTKLAKSVSDTFFPSVAFARQQLNSGRYIDLLDLEIVVGPPREAGEQKRLEVLSPKKSFALYASKLTILSR